MTKDFVARLPVRRLGLLALAFALTSLSACGLTGDLKRGEPLIGKPDAQTEPAKLPDAPKNSLPPLPERPATDPAVTDADDELLGGPGT
jgi:Prokaryotic lipoprotein-attachment site